MDWLGGLLSFIGFAEAGRTRTADKRQEAYRLLAEAGGNLSRSLDLIDHHEARLLTRLDGLAPEAGDVRASIKAAFAKFKADLVAAGEMLAKCRSKVEGASGGQLDRAIAGLVELHATSARFVPWVENVAAHFDAVFDNARMGG